MTNEEMWSQLCERHPNFKDPEFVLKMRAKGLKALIDQAYDEGKKKGVAVGNFRSNLDKFLGK